MTLARDLPVHHGMKVRELMRRALTLGPDMPISVAREIMLWAGARHIPVLLDGELVGILSERDVLRYRAEAGGPVDELPVRAAMSSPARFIHADDSVLEAAERMVAHRIGALPVLEKGNVIGIVTSTDLLAYQARTDLKHPPPEPPVYDKTAADIMSKAPLSARAEDALLDAVAKMARTGVRHLPVTNGDDAVIGMLSDRDTRTAIGEPHTAFNSDVVRVKLETMRVVDAMTPNPYTIRESERLATILAYLLDYRVGALPVVDEDHRLSGIVSYVDVLETLRQLASPAH